MQSETNQSCSAEGIRVAILVSDYHGGITKNLWKAAKDAFIEAGGQSEDCLLIHVDGAWELPILAKAIADINHVDAIVALGCVLTGETTHDQIIGETIADGLMKVSLDWGHPVSMGVLTCQTIEQAAARAGGSSGNKGIEAMHAAIGTATTLRNLQT